MKIVFVKRIIIFLCIFCITWSCSSDNDVFCEEELIEETNLLVSPLDLPYNLIYPLKEPFATALTELYKDGLGKKLCKLMRKILGNGKVGLVYNANLDRGEMRLENDVEGNVFEYGMMSGVDDRALGTLLAHEFFHIYQNNRGNVDDRNRLNHEIEAYVFQFLLCRSANIVLSSPTSNESLFNLFWEAIKGLVELMNDQGGLKKGVTQQEFIEKYEIAIVRLRIYNPEYYGSMMEDSYSRTFSNIATFLSEKEK